MNPLKRENVGGKREYEGMRSNEGSSPQKRPDPATGAALAALQAPAQAVAPVNARRILNVPAPIQVDPVRTVSEQLANLSFQIKELFQGLLPKYVDIKELSDDDFSTINTAIVPLMIKMWSLAVENNAPIPKGSFFLIALLQVLNKCPNRPQNSLELERLREIAVQIIRSQGFDPDFQITEKLCEKVALGRKYAGATLYWLAAHFNHEGSVRAMHACRPGININAKVEGSSESDDPESEFYGNVFAQAILHKNWSLALEMLSEDRKVDLGMWVERSDTIRNLFEFIVDEDREWQDPGAEKVKHRMLDYCQKLPSIGKLETGFKFVRLFNPPGPGPLAKHFILREMSLCHEPDQRTLTLENMQTTKQSVLVDVHRTWKYTECEPAEDEGKYLNRQLIRTIRDNVNLLEQLLREIALSIAVFKRRESRQITNKTLNVLRERDPDLRNISDNLLIQVLYLFRDAEFERMQKEASGAIAERVMTKWQENQSFDQDALFCPFAPGNVEYVKKLIGDMIAKKYLGLQESLIGDWPKQNEIVERLAALPFARVTRELLEKTLNNIHLPAQNFSGLGSVQS